MYKRIYVCMYISYIFTWARALSADAALYATGAADRTKVICDNKDYACGVDKPRIYKLTCADAEDQPTLWSSYKYICCPGESNPDSACAAGLCAGGYVNGDGIICDNKEEGSPCGSDVHAELCGSKEEG